jgi:hypothetical protein
MNDDKFINEFIKLSSSIRENEKYIIVSDKDDLKYVTRVKGMTVVPSHNELRNILQTQDNIVYIHFLSDRLIHVINSTVVRAVIVWMVWGADLYSMLAIRLYERNTARAMRRAGLMPSLGTKKWAGRLRRLARLRRQKINCLHKISHIAHYNTYDVELLQSITKTPLSHKRFFYPDGLMMSEDEDPLIVNARSTRIKSVIVGNSADPTNNHIDIFSRFERNDYERLYCPLSYGSSRYAYEVVSYASKRYGEKFIPLLEYLSASEYRSILENVDLGIYAHHRSQAVGNIRALLAMGKGVALYRSTTTYKYFNEYGVRFIKYPLPDTLTVKLSDEVLHSNQNIVRDMFSIRKCRKYLCELYADIAATSRR